MEKHLLSLSSQLAGIEIHKIKLSIRPPLTHQSNRLYDIWFDNQHWIAKEYLNKDEFADAPRREHLSLQLIEHLDIAPKPIHYAPLTAHARPIVFYKYMEGKMWDRKTPTEIELSRLAQVWLTMHQAKHDNLWLSRGQESSLEEALIRTKHKLQAYRDWAHQFYPQGAVAADWGFEILKNREPELNMLSAMEQVLVFSRADPRFANVIAKPDGQLGLVDWEDAGLRDPARDLADMMIHPNQEDLVSTALWEAFLKPYYKEHTTYDPQIEQRTHLYQSGACLVWYAGLLYFGVNRALSEKLSGWQINGMPANQRLRRYLARCRAWPDGDLDKKVAELEDFCFFPE